MEEAANSVVAIFVGRRAVRIFSACEYWCVRRWVWASQKASFGFPGHGEGSAFRLDDIWLRF